VWTSPRVVRRRLNVRKKVSIKGKVIFVAGMSQTVDSMIVDLSPGGARVELCEDYVLPDEVLLFEANNQNVFECVVRWRKDRSAGLNFVDYCSKAVRLALLEDKALGLMEACEPESAEDEAS